MARERGSNPRCYKLLCVITWILLLIAAGLLIDDLVLEYICLDLGKSSAKCYFSDEKWETLAEVAEVIEPCLSVSIVTAVLVLYCCRFKCECSSLILYLCKYSYGLRRFLLLVLAIAYLIFVYTVDTLVQRHSPKRYIFLAIGVTSWFVLLLVANELGPLSSIYRHNGLCCMGFLSSTIYFFACLTNFAEFVVVTVYLTKTLWSVPSTDETMVNVADILGMTVTITLRLDYASCFWELAFLSNQNKVYGGKYKILTDPWNDWQESTSRHEVTNSSTRCEVQVDMSRSLPTAVDRHASAMADTAVIGQSERFDRASPQAAASYNDAEAYVVHYSRRDTDDVDAVSFERSGRYSDRGSFKGYGSLNEI